MFEAYKIGITLSLTNHVSRGLAMMAGDFARTDAQATVLQKRIKSIQVDAIKGGLMLGAGVAMLSLFKAPLEEAKKFDQALGKFKLFGMSDAQNADAVKFVRSMDVMGTSYVENMKLMTEAQGVFRESGMKGEHALAGAKIAAPMLAKIQFASAGLDDESKAKMHTQSMAMLRFVEMRGGLKDAASFNAIADAGWKAVQSSGGNVNFEQLRQFMARGGVAAQGLTDTALFAKLEPIIGELKGSTAGNAWMTSYNRLVGGVRIPNQVAHQLAESGIWDKSRIEWNDHGGIKRFKGNPLKDMETFSSDPVEFYEKNILPMYAKLNGGKGMNIKERSRENTMIFGRTGGMMFSLIDRQLETIHRSTSAWEKALTVDKSVKVAGSTLAGKEVDLDAKWAKVKNDLGNIILPYAIIAVEKLSSGLKFMAGWIERNEGLTKLLVGALAMLAGGLMIRGSVLLLSAAFRGLGLALLFKSAGGPAALGWIARGLSAIGSVIGLASLGSTLLVIGAGFAGWKLGTWFNDAFVAGTKFSNWLGGIIAHLMAPFSKEAATAVKNTTGKEWYQFGPKSNIDSSAAATQVAWDRALLAKAAPAPIQAPRLPAPVLTTMPRLVPAWIAASPAVPQRPSAPGAPPSIPRLPAPGVSTAPLRLLIAAQLAAMPVVSAAPPPAAPNRLLASVMSAAAPAPRAALPSRIIPPTLPVISPASAATARPTTILRVRVAPSATPMTRVALPNWISPKTPAMPAAARASQAAAAAPSILTLPRIPTVMAPPATRVATAMQVGQSRPVVIAPKAADRPAAQAATPYVSGQQKQVVQITSNTYLDSRLISTEVVERLVSGMGGPAGSGNAVDPRMSALSPSMVR